MALFPRTNSAFSDEFISKAYERMVNDPTESNTIGFWTPFINYYWTRQKGFSFRPYSYVRATEDQRRRDDHLFFVIDGNIEHLPPGGQITTHTLVEFKEKDLSDRKHVVAEKNLENVAEAFTARERLDFLWTMQCHGPELLIKYYNPAPGPRHGLDASRGIRDGNHVDWCEVRRQEPAVAAKFLEMQNERPSRRGSGTGRNLAAAADPGDRHGTVSSTEHRTHAKQDDRHSESKSVEVKTTKFQYKGKRGRTYVNQHKDTIFVPDSEWREATLGDSRVLFCKKENIYTPL